MSLNESGDGTCAAREGGGAKRETRSEVKIKRSSLHFGASSRPLKAKENAVTFWFNWTTIDARSISNSTPPYCLAVKESSSISRLPLIPWSNLWGGELITSKEEEPLMTILFLFSFDEGEEIRRTDWFDRHLMIRFPARRSKCENSLKICSLRQKHHLCTARHLCMSSPLFLDAQCYYYSISNVFSSTHFQSGDIASCTFTFLALLQHPKFPPLHNGRATDIISPRTFCRGWAFDVRTTHQKGSISWYTSSWFTFSSFGKPVIYNSAGYTINKIERSN